MADFDNGNSTMKDFGKNLADVLAEKKAAMESKNAETAGNAAAKQADEPLKGILKPKKENADFVQESAPVNIEPAFEQPEAAPELNEEPKEEPKPKAAPEPKPEPVKVQEIEQPLAEVGVISAGTTIEGDIISKGHLNIDGVIKGTVTALGDVSVTGDVTGDITCNNVVVKGGAVKANLNARGDVTIIAGAKVDGNIAGKNVDIEGVVNGNINALESVQITSEAVVNGDVTTGKIAVGLGAELNGCVKTLKRK